MANKTPLLPAMLEQVAETFRVLGDGSRLEILQALMAGPKTVSEVVGETGKGQANVSKHLGVLLAAGLVSRKKQGTQAIYEVADPLVHALCEMVCGSLRARLEQQVKAQQRVLNEMARSGSSAAKPLAAKAGRRAPTNQHESHE